MKTTRILIALTAASLLPLGAALGADNNPLGKEKSAAAERDFRKLDTDQDGRISQAEAAVDSTIAFSSADRNADGYLDQEEWKSTRKGGMNTPQTTPSDPAGEPVGTTPPDTATPGR